MRIILLLSVFCLFPSKAMAADIGPWQQFIAYVYTQQQVFHHELASAIRAVQDGGLIAVWGLILTSFLYGVFHAAGPGHGKAIISTYITTHDSHLRRALGLSFASSLMQGVSAILIVTLIFGLAGHHASVQVAAKYTEQFSFALIAFVGVVLMLRVLKIICNRSLLLADEHNHGHSCCGHSHAVDPKVLKDDMSWKMILGVIVSVGMRPCTGAVLVLIFAMTIGVPWAGVGAVMAMSLGAAMTVGVLAFFAVYCRQAAFFVWQKSNSYLVENIFVGLSFLGGLIIFLLGASFFMQAVMSKHPLF